MSKARIHYARVDEFWRKEQKYRFLEEKQQRSNIEWQKIHPDEKHTWLTEGLQTDFDGFLALGTKEAKQKKTLNANTVFKEYSSGVNTARDFTVYDFHRADLAKKIELFCDDYNAEVHRYRQKGEPKGLDDFLSYEKVKWSLHLKLCLKAKKLASFDPSKIRHCLYRPFTPKLLFFDSVLIDAQTLQKYFFPIEDAENENCAIHISDKGFRSTFSVLISRTLADFHVVASTDNFQSFPFYTYDKDGSNRKENITDWALAEYRSHYKKKSITKWDIFHYVYALLHHPVYRTRYAANLKRELPRVPYAPDFHAFAQAGKRLAELHVDYEKQPEYPLEMIESPEASLDWRVEKMRLSKDKTQIVYNDFLTLAGIPAEAFEYRLGNRSALDWVIDQYQVSTDKRSDITNDPNRADDPQYIVRLIGQVITVSLETMKIVRALPDLGIAAQADELK
ncbi:MAG: hypothetical protein V7641_3016 [Blastocatellia bacterium]